MMCYHNVFLQIVCLYINVYTNKCCTTQHPFRNRS